MVFVTSDGKNILELQAVVALGGIPWNPNGIPFGMEVPWND